MCGPLGVSCTTFWKVLVHAEVPFWLQPVPWATYQTSRAQLAFITSDLKQIKRTIKRPIEKQLEVEKLKMYGEVKSSLPAFVILAAASGEALVSCICERCVERTHRKGNPWDTKSPFGLRALRGELRLVAHTEVSVPKKVTVLTELPTPSMQHA